MSATLLPPNATPFERTIEAATWRLGDEGPNGIRALWNAETIPAQLLPWLAWALNVDAWDASWDEAKKRSVVATALALHRIDGTLAAVRRVTELHGGTLVKVIRPPCQLFYGPAPTQAERDAALAVFPQLVLRADNSPFVVPAGATFPRRSYAGHSYSVDLDAAQRALPRAFIEDHGSTTECAVEQVTQDGASYLRVRRPITNRWGSYGGAFPHYGVTAEAPVYLLQTTQNYAGSGLGVNYKLVSSGVTPAQVYPDWISESYPAWGLYPGTYAGGTTYWRASEAGRHVYARLYLFDAARTLEATGKSFFLDAVRTGIQPHSAELRVCFPQHRPGAAPRYYGHGYLAPEDSAWLGRYLDNLERCTAVRDQILIDTRAYAVVTSGPGFVCGEQVTSGAMRIRE
jgi:phage tail P2-like protein